MVVLNWSFDRSVINVMAFPLSGAPSALSTFGVMNWALLVALSGHPSKRSRPSTHEGP
jgi:hypothetical protein